METELALLAQYDVLRFSRNGFSSPAGIGQYSFANGYEIRHVILECLFGQIRVTNTTDSYDRHIRHTLYGPAEVHKGCGLVKTGINQPGL